MDRIGVVDTMFAVTTWAQRRSTTRRLPGHGERFEVVRRTVPGFKDLAVAAKVLIEEHDCRIVVALGMPARLRSTRSAPMRRPRDHDGQLMTNTRSSRCSSTRMSPTIRPWWRGLPEPCPQSTPATPTGCSTSPSSSHAGPARVSARDSTTRHSIPSSAEARGQRVRAKAPQSRAPATSMRVMAR